MLTIAVLKIGTARKSDEGEEKMMWRWRRGSSTSLEKGSERLWGSSLAEDTQLCFKTNCNRFFFPSSHKHHNISSVYLCLLLWLSVREILTLKKPKAGRAVHIFMLLRERYDAMASYRTRVIFLCVHIFLALDKQLHHFMLNQETQASLLLLQINESLLFLFFFTKFLLISAFPRLFSCSQRARRYAADGWGTTAKEDVDTVILRLMAPVI